MLPREGPTDSDPAWSPDGRWIAYRDLETGRHAQLTSFGRVVDFPILSRDRA